MKKENEGCNILHISRTMDIGGAERIVYQLATDLKEEFSNVHVASTGGLWEIKLKEAGVYHHKIADIDSKKPKVIFSILKNLNNIIKVNNITIVHTHHRMAAFYIRLLQMFHPKLIHIYTAHNVFHDKLSLYNFSLKHTHTIAVSHAVKKNLLKDAKVHDVEVIYNGVKFDKTSRTVRHITDYAGIKIGCVARLAEQKGLAYLIKALKILEKQEIKLFIVGEGELRDELLEQTEKLGITNKVEFLGYRRDVMECINSFDFCILPSLYEGFGLVAIETFMNGKTIIATDIPGVNEIVNEGNGILVPVKDSERLAEAIELLASDFSLRETLAEQARRDYEERFSYSIFINSYKEYYRKIKGDDV